MSAAYEVSAEVILSFYKFFTYETFFNNIFSICVSRKCLFVHCFEQDLSIQDLDEISEIPAGEFSKVDRDNLIQKLNVDKNKGLDSSRVELMREQYGRNYIEPRRPPLYIELLWGAFQDTTIIMLLVAMIVQAVFAFTIEKTVSSYIEGSYCNM